MAQAAFTPGKQPASPVTPRRVGAPRGAQRISRTNDRPFDTRTGFREIDTRVPYTTTRNAQVANELSRPTVSDTFNQQYQKAGLQPTSRFTEREPNTTPRPNQQNEMYSTGRRMTLEQINTARTPLGKTVSAETTTEGTAEARMAVLRVNRIAWWVLGGVATLQFFLGAMSLVFLAIAFGSNAAFDSWIGQAFASIMDTVLSIFDGADLEFGQSYAPALALSILITLLGLVQYIILILVYYMSGITQGVSPVFGSGSLAKIFSILLGIIGYAFPLVNLVPWIYGYTWVMERYPK